MARIQETLLRGRPVLRPVIFEEKKITELFGSKTAAEAKESYGEKQERIRNPAVTACLRSEWESIAGRIEKIHLPSSSIAAILKEAGAPVTPEALGGDDEIYGRATKYARFLRDRFTFLDLE